MDFPVGGGGFMHHHAIPTSFSKSVRCFSSAFIDKPQLENGDKIIVPEVMLAELQHIIASRVMDLK